MRFTACTCDAMVSARRNAENKIAELRGRIRNIADRHEQLLIRRELMVEIAMLQELETVAHLREMAARYRQLATATWDGDVYKILNEMSRDYDNEAHAIERGREANDA